MLRLKHLLHNLRLFGARFALNPTLCKHPSKLFDSHLVQIFQRILWRSLFADVWLRKAKSGKAEHQHQQQRQQKAAEPHRTKNFRLCRCCTCLQRLLESSSTFRRIFFPAMSSRQEQLLAAKEIEIAAMSDLFNNIVKNCVNKCINPTYRDGELAKSEAVCVDRCSAKYFQLHEFVGNKLNELQQAAEAAAEGGVKIQ
eukprot:m.180496 g.180496  ORF g.180496 m.180496 type:complete len:198 (-) comp21467_c0_seq1:391-984(-)